MSVDRVSGEWRMVFFLMMHGGGGVICVSLCRYLINARFCGFRDTMLSDIDGWYLVRLTDLGVCVQK